MYLNSYKFSITNSLFNGGFAIEADNFVVSAKNQPWISSLFLSKAYKENWTDNYQLRN